MTDDPTSLENAGGLEPEPEAALVPVDDDGTFLFVGKVPDGFSFGIEPVPYLAGKAGDRLWDHLGTAAVGSNVLAQGADAALRAGGLVRIAPETLAAMQAGAIPLSDGGQMVGTMMKNGRFAGHMRLVPAGPAGYAPVLAQMGPAFALLAIQMQLTRISKAIERNIALSQTVLDEIREDLWYELGGSARIVMDAVLEAQAVGEVTEQIWDHMESQTPLATLLKHRQRNLDALGRQLADPVRRSQPQRWFEENSTSVLRSAEAIMTAQQAIALHDIVRTAYIRQGDGETQERLAEHVMRQARLRHDEASAVVDTALRDLYRSLALWEEADRSKRLKIEGRTLSLRELRTTVESLHERATAATFTSVKPIPAPRALQIREHNGIRPGELRGLEDRLRWILEPTEELVLVYEGRFKINDGQERRLLVITDNRALLVDWQELERGQAIVETLPIGGEIQRQREGQWEVVTVSAEYADATLRVKESQQALLEALLHLRARIEPGDSSTSPDVP